jgi:hypothetical protein
MPYDPANATGDLQQFSVFNRDTLRPGFDPTGFIQRVMLSRMPLPNDFTVGDGLNTAGYRWTRRISGLELNQGNGVQTNRDQFNTRIDHQFDANNKFSFIYTFERGLNQASLQESRSGREVITATTTSGPCCTTFHWFQPSLKLW